MQHDPYLILEIENRTKCRYNNSNEAMQEIGFDIQEGSDIVIIKPTLPYLDLLYKAKQETNIPICAYSVSGEYSIIKAAAIEGWIK